MEPINIKEKSPNQAVNELVAFLAPLAEGELVPDFNNKLHQLVKAVRDTGRVGAISMTIKIEKAKGSETQMIIHSEVSAKKPETSKPMSLYFSDEDGGLHRSDPRQLNLFNAEK